MKICVSKVMKNRFAAPDVTLWAPGQTITISFTNGSRWQREKVQEYAQEWSSLGGLKLQFISYIGMVRISFYENMGSWSYVGREALGVPDSQSTMNLGWVTPDEPEDSIRGVILHEFGHMLGLIHEHQSPAAGIPWDEEKVYKYYRGSPNYWSDETIKANIFDKYQGEITNSIFDPESIMLYPIPNALTKGDYEVGWNNKLSHQDKEFFRKAYGKLQSP